MPLRPPIAVLRHSSRDETGFIPESLARYSLPYTVFDLRHDPSQTIPLRDVPALIVLGGSHSVNARLDFLEKEKRLIADAISMDKPVLGVCLGSQLMANALGEAVFRIPTPEIGWLPVRATPEAATDPLFGDWGEQTVFHWHNEGFRLPAGVVGLASSDSWANQAFRYGDRHWAVQFHPEVTPAIISSWCEEDAACPERELMQKLDHQWNAQHLRRLANRLFDRWAEIVIDRS